MALTQLVRSQGTVLIRTHIKQADKTWAPDPALKGTILGWLVGQDPKIRCGSTWVSTREILEGHIRSQRIAHTIKGERSDAFYVVATGRLNVLDYFVSGRRVDPGLQKSEAARLIKTVTNPSFDWPAIMRHTIGCPAAPGEMWLSPRDARALVATTFYAYPEQLPEEIRFWAEVWLNPDQDAISVVDRRHAARVIEEILDGCAAFGERYPNITSTSFSPTVLRVVRGFAPAIGVNLGWFIHQFQGDADGDLAYVVAPPGFSFSKPAATKSYRVRSTPSGVGGRSLGFFDLPAPTKSTYSSFAGQLVRGKYVGLLTRANWILCSLAQRNAAKLGMSPHSAYVATLDLGAPMVEGVMDARKDADGGDTIVKCAEAILGCVGGRVSIANTITLVARHLKRSDDHPEDVNHFSEEQISFFSKLLRSALPDGPNEGKVDIAKLVGVDPALNSAYVTRSQPGFVFNEGQAGQKLLNSLYREPSAR